MLEDPEYGPQFIIPLKMQGVAEIADRRDVICASSSPRSRPGLGPVQREALKRVYRALWARAGIDFASNQVTVKSGAPADAAAASAASQPAAPAPAA